jgi:hypothetical protein
MQNVSFHDVILYLSIKWQFDEEANIFISIYLSSKKGVYT